MNEVAKVTEAEVVEAPTIAAPVDPMLAMIERVAMNPDADIAKMRELLAMRREEEDRHREVEFNAAVADAQREMQPVVTNAYNEQTRSKYARLEAISRAIDPIVSKHGFGKSFGQADCPKDDHLRITLELTHRSGFAKHYHLDVPIDGAGMAGKINKTKTHALGSTMSYGRRYLKLMAFDIATGDDDDGNAAGSEYITEAQVTELQELLAAHGVNERDFLAFAKIENLGMIPAKKFTGAKAALIQRGNANA